MGLVWFQNGLFLFLVVTVQVKAPKVFLKCLGCLTFWLWLDILSSLLFLLLQFVRHAHYQAGNTPLALVWKDNVCSQYVLDTDNKGQIPSQQQV